MIFDEVLPGMIFENYQPPQFLLVNSKIKNTINLISIDSGIRPGDDGFEENVFRSIWEDYFEELPLAEPEVYKKVVAELLK